MVAVPGNGSSRNCDRLSAANERLGWFMRRLHPASLGSMVLVVAAVLVTEPGCNSSAKRSVVGSSVSSSSEPALSPEGSSGSGVTIISPSGSGSEGTAKSVSFVNRHPLLRKPQQYYDNTNSNKVVKTAAAAFIGVPSGFVGEVKQIFVGAPAPTAAVPAY